MVNAFKNTLKKLLSHVSTNQFYFHRHFSTSTWLSSFYQGSVEFNHCSRAGGYVKKVYWTKMARKSLQVMFRTYFIYLLFSIFYNRTTTLSRPLELRPQNLLNLLASIVLLQFRRKPKLFIWHNL